MDEKIEVLLNKINMDKESFPYFSNAKLTKIKIHRKTSSWEVFIENKVALPVEVIEELEQKKMALDENAKEITIIWNIENIDVNTYLSYYPYVLQQVKEELKVLEIYSDALRVEEGFLVLVATTQIEQERLEGCLEKINRIYKNLGYKFNIDVELRHEDNILEEIKQDLVVNVKLKEKHEEKKEEQPKEKKYHKEPKDPNSVIGRGIKEEAIKIKTLLGEDNNVVVEGYVFGTDYFESSKTDFKIITLKITDYSDSIYCKVFVRDNDEYKRLCKELKAGSWFKIRGYTKEDQFAKELVLNARDIVKIDKKEEKIEDKAEVKRV